MDIFQPVETFYLIRHNIGFFTAQTLFRLLTCRKCDVQFVLVEMFHLIPPQHGVSWNFSKPEVIPEVMFSANYMSTNLNEHKYAIYLWSYYENIPKPFMSMSTLINHHLSAIISHLSITVSYPSTISHHFSPQYLANGTCQPLDLSTTICQSLQPSYVSCQIKITFLTFFIVLDFDELFVTPLLVSQQACYLSRCNHTLSHKQYFECLLAQSS